MYIPVLEWPTGKRTRRSQCLAAPFFCQLISQTIKISANVNYFYVGYYGGSSYIKKLVSGPFKERDEAFFLASRCAVQLSNNRLQSRIPVVLQ